jgi:hypothetical protein
MDLHNKSEVFRNALSTSKTVDLSAKKTSSRLLSREKTQSVASRNAITPSKDKEISLKRILLQHAPFFSRNLYPRGCCEYLDVIIAIVEFCIIVLAMAQLEETFRAPFWVS